MPRYGQSGTKSGPSTIPQAIELLPSPPRSHLCDPGAQQKPPVAPWHECEPRLTVADLFLLDRLDPATLSPAHDTLQDFSQHDR
jgi:hypothetical protein